MTSSSCLSLIKWGTSLLAVCAVNAAFGQQAGTNQSVPAANGNGNALEEIVVTGLRQSIAAAIEAKRVASNIVDIVNAEDIGKLPDQNVAETLGRISGINIARKDGEGSNFTVRGLSLNRVEINGRSFVGPTQDATPALETVNPEILSGIEVIKSPTADLVEGAIGATVNLKTRRPLDGGGEGILSTRGQLVYADKADKTGFRTSGLISESFGDGNFGALLGLAYARIYARGEGLTTNGWVRTNAIDGNGDGVNDAGLFRPNRISSQIEEREDDRSTATGALQWRPDEVTELILEGTYSRFKRARDLGYYQLLLNDNDVAGSASALADGTVSRATLTGITLRPLAYDAPSDLESYNFGLSGKREMGAFTLTADASYSRGEGSENQAGLSTGAPFTYVIVPRAGNTVDVSYDFANRNFPNYSLSSNFNRDDPAQYRLFSIFDGVARSENRGYDGRLDLAYDAQWGALSSVQTGVRYEDIRLISSDPQSTPAAAALLAAADDNGDGIITLDELPAVSYRNQLGGDFFPEAAGSFPRSFLTGDVLSVAQARSDVGLGEPARVPASERNVDQRTPAGYARANFAGELFSLPYVANLGVRYVSTRRTARGNAVATSASGVTTTPTELTKTFSQWLPSGNISFNLTDDLLLRLAASKVVARPALRDVAPGITVSLTTFTAAAGTPDLRPIEADQYDAALEWYFADASLLSVALYQKDISTFIISTTSVETLDGYPPSAVNPSGLFQVNRPRNGTGGRVQGFEIGYQHAFRFLPSPFDGFGVVTNYTYADSETPIQDPLGGGTLPLSNLSRDSYNLVGYYENDLFTVRLAYTYRSKFLVALDSAALGGARYEDEYGQLDASASLALSDRFRLTLDATNLNKAITRQYNGTWSRLTAASVNDTRYTLGITASF